MAHQVSRAIKGSIKSLTGGLGIFGQPSQGESGPTQIPNLFTAEQGRGFAGRADVLAGQRTRNPFLSQLQDQFGEQSPFQGALNQATLNPQASPFRQTLQDAILNPNFAPRSEAEQNLVGQAFSGRQGQFNALGIGSSPAAQSAIAAAGAGTLANLRQNQIGNLFAGQQQFGADEQRNIGNLLAGQGQFGLDQSRTLQNLLGASGQFGRQDLASKGLNIEALLRLANLGQPRFDQQRTETGASRGILDQVGAFVGNIK